MFERGLRRRHYYKMTGCCCVSYEYGFLGINQQAAPDMSCVSHIFTGTESELPISVAAQIADLCGSSAKVAMPPRGVPFRIHLVSRYFN